MDLFAGTGNIGIEALSRGAGHVVLVEKDPRAARTIKQNIRDAGLESGARVLTSDVYRALEELAAGSAADRQGQGKFDLVFLDPPYGMGFELPVIGRVLELGLLAQGGLIIAESGKREELPPDIKGLLLNRQERYGDTLLSFYS